MASVTYGKCIMANVIMAKIFMAKILWQMKLKYLWYGAILNCVITTQFDNSLFTIIPIVYIDF